MTTRLYSTQGRAHSVRAGRVQDATCTAVAGRVERAEPTPYRPDQGDILVKVYFDFNDWYIGYYRGSHYHFFVCFTLVFRFHRRPTVPKILLDGGLPYLIFQSRLVSKNYTHINKDKIYVTKKEFRSLP